MKKIIETVAERQEADQLGISKVTEASLREFNKAINDAITSGIITSKAT